MEKITSIGEILFDIFNIEKKLGGAPFNFLYHIMMLTGQGNFISRIGNNRLGKSILEFFKFKKISPDYIQIDKIHPTGEAKAVLNDEKIPEWKIKTDTSYDFIEFNKKIKKLVVEKTDCIYFGTLAQRKEISRSTIQSLFNRNVKYFYDLKYQAKFLFKKCY